MTVDEARGLFGLKENKQLAEFLGKSESAVSAWNVRGEIPAAAEKRIWALLGDRGVEIPGFAKKKPDHSPFMKEIIGLTENLSMGKQAEAYALLCKHFTDEL